MKSVLRKSTLGQQTAAVLRERIIKGNYRQGEHLIEEELAGEFEVSRATVREALRLLETEGLLVREINKYTYVHSLSEKEIKDLFAMRVLLEREAVDFCVANHCVPQEELSQLVEKMKFYVEEGRTDWDAHLQADMGFHASVIKATDNPYILRFWKLMESQYKMAMYKLRSIHPKIFLGTHEEHRKIFEQLLEGNKEPWYQHLENSRHDVDTIMKNRQ